jgi:hypothetical protein
MPALIASGSIGHAFTTATKAGSKSAFDVKIRVFFVREDGAPNARFGRLAFSPA